MQHINNLKDVKHINLIVFDVDGVIVPRGTDIIESDSIISFNLKFPPKEFIETAKELLNYSNIAISSGRSMLTLKTIFAELFGECKNNNHFILQAENGGRISIGPEEIGAGHNPEYIRSLSDLRSKLREVKHEHIRGFEPKETFLTLHCYEKIPQIEELINKNKYYILWSGEAYDIGDPNITKGTGLQRIKNLLSKRTGKEINAIAIGDRQNDIDLLEQADISVSADAKLLTEANYYVQDNTETLPGLILAKHLLEKFKFPINNNKIFKPLIPIKNMTEKNQVYKCEICGNIVEVLHEGNGELVCCGQPMKLQRENTIDASTEKHIPIISKEEENKITIKVGEVPHPMTEEHYIEWIEKDVDGKICRKHLQPGEEPEAKFCLKDPDSKVKAREYCNLHGLWKSGEEKKDEL
jgi:superoxide reductase